MPEQRKKPTYTTKVHARRLLQMLNHSSIYHMCPAKRGFNTLTRTGPFCNTWNGEPCKVCKSFIRLSFMDTYCPCYAFGYKLDNMDSLKKSSAEALKRTWLALEEGGFLE